ncbi:hypothetical protein ACFCZI_23715, partial [Peribacillus butanolivorans]|uniref:hypothetical protein n=1 Tax=Peribacillus butanolivorans TaxID=421767 RepID=UPI0035DA25AB
YDSYISRMLTYSQDFITPEINYKLFESCSFLIHSSNLVNTLWLFSIVRESPTTIPRKFTARATFNSCEISTPTTR